MNLNLDYNRKRVVIDERDIYRLSRFGYTQAVIAQKLGIGGDTLSRHLNKSLTLMSARHRGLREYELSKSAG